VSATFVENMAMTAATARVKICNSIPWRIFRSSYDLTVPLKPPGALTALTPCHAIAS
jgi:hypothetical protein